ncbi:MAG: hypothetical protein NPIRA01_01690 [Nitrospirales bacterium]|nr:MAG: hypothetical protein NPIRA01_01690 [Nitrospirales bacterium]
MAIQTAPNSFPDALIAVGQSQKDILKPTLMSAPLFAALKTVGTSHVYADTADSEELRKLLEEEHHTIIEEIDGNTVNQPLVKKVLTRYLQQDFSDSWPHKLIEAQRASSVRDLVPMAYAIVCGRIGNDLIHAFASGRSWEVSLQLHMSVMTEPETAKSMGRSLRKMVPSALVKVPFTPHAPACFLIARDLENEGIPVNFTSTFSARQVVAAALLGNVTRTNIFMGRLDQGFQAELLGAHVTLEAQRILHKLRTNARVKTQLIVASIRQWESLVQTAGCDVYTAPCKVLRAFLQQNDVPPESIENQLTTSYANQLGIPDSVRHHIDTERLARLYEVESEFLEFLLTYRQTDEYQQLNDPDTLVTRFEEAGFKDFFTSPFPSQWKELQRGKVPNLIAPITQQFDIDTLYSLLADADFEQHQNEMDQEIEEHLVEER